MVTPNGWEGNCGPGGKEWQPNAGFHDYACMSMQADCLESGIGSSPLHSIICYLYLYVIWLKSTVNYVIVDGGIQVKVRPGTYEFESALEDWMRRVREEHNSDGRLYYQLQQLYPSSYYQLEVRAMNDVGWSQPNPQFIFKTAAGELQYIWQGWKIL